MSGDAGRRIRRDENERVTYTYTAPSGAIIVIRNVPAFVSWRSGKRNISYRGSVAGKLQRLVKAALATATAGLVSDLVFDESPNLPVADYEIEFIGPKTSFSNASLQTWKLIFDKSYTSVKAAMRSVGAKAVPTVSYLAPASIMLGLRTGHQRELFEFDTESASASEKAMRLLIDTARWLDNEISLPAYLTDDDAMLDVMLRAVEELAPNDEETSVLLRRVGHSEQSTFTRQKKMKAQSERIAIRLKDPSAARRVELVGKLSRLDVDGDASVREIQTTDEWTAKSISCRYDNALLATLLENFGKRVNVSLIQRNVGGSWSTKDLELVDISRHEGES
jgi:hypothetical protein